MVPPPPAYWACPSGSLPTVILPFGAPPGRAPPSGPPARRLGCSSRPPVGPPARSRAWMRGERHRGGGVRRGGRALRDQGRRCARPRAGRDRRRLGGERGGGVHVEPCHRRAGAGQPRPPGRDAGASGRGGPQQRQRQCRDGQAGSRRRRAHVRACRGRARLRRRGSVGVLDRAHRHPAADGGTREWGGAARRPSVTGRRGRGGRSHPHDRHTSQGGRGAGPWLHGGGHGEGRGNAGTRHGDDARRAHNQRGVRSIDAAPRSSTRSTTPSMLCRSTGAHRPTTRSSSWPGAGRGR